MPGVVPLSTLEGSASSSLSPPLLSSPSPSRAVPAPVVGPPLSHKDTDKDKDAVPSLVVLMAQDPLEQPVHLRRVVAETVTKASDCTKQAMHLVKQQQQQQGGGGTSGSVRPPPPPRPRGFSWTEGIGEEMKSETPPSPQAQAQAQVLPEDSLSSSSSPEAITGLALARLGLLPLSARDLRRPITTTTTTATTRKEAEEDTSNSKCLLIRGLPLRIAMCINELRCLTVATVL